jgi:hypothetical protein
LEWRDTNERFEIFKLWINHYKLEKEMTRRGRYCNGVCRWVVLRLWGIGWINHYKLEKEMMNSPRALLQRRLPLSCSARDESFPSRVCSFFPNTLRLNQQTAAWQRSRHIIITGRQALARAWPWLETATVADWQLWNHSSELNWRQKHASKLRNKTSKFM